MVLGIHPRPSPTHATRVCQKTAAHIAHSLTRSPVHSHTRLSPLCLANPVLPCRRLHLLSITAFPFVRFPLSFISIYRVFPHLHLPNPVTRPALPDPARSLEPQPKTQLIPQTRPVFCRSTSSSTIFTPLSLASPHPLLRPLSSPRLDAKKPTTHHSLAPRISSPPNIPFPQRLLRVDALTISPGQEPLLPLNRFPFRSELRACLKELCICSTAESLRSLGDLLVAELRWVEFDRAL
ncbi:hypothetical protein EDB80DRAFT_416864 [Ilyonectria destructans]|nr:hypothetical protein EDB80DRAFT_416864 [Ilyonectria destructans]